MKQYQRKIKEYKSLIQKEYIQETAVCTVMERCSDIVSRQDNRRASYFEFLFEQFKFIKKRWWALQGEILFLLWILLGGLRWRSKYRADTGGYVGDVFCDDRTEIWKNRKIFCSRDRKNGILFTAPDLCCKDIAICNSGSGYDYSFFQYFSLYTTDFGIPDHHRFSSAA